MKEEISKEDLLLMVKQLDLSLDARMNRIMGKKGSQRKPGGGSVLSSAASSGGKLYPGALRELYRLQKKLLRSIREERET